MKNLAARSRFHLGTIQNFLAILTVGCSHAVSSQVSQQPKVGPSPALMLSPLAGQSIPVLPATYLITADTVNGLPRDHAAQLAWADSIVMAQLTMRGPEVTWLPPSELRKYAARAPGTITEPDKMGQAILRSSSLKTTPDALMVKLRPMLAMANARYVMVPAALFFTQTANGVEASATFVILDARTSTILWRSEPRGNGVNAAAALSAIFPRILP